MEAKPFLAHLPELATVREVEESHLICFWERSPLPKPTVELGLARGCLAEAT